MVEEFLLTVHLRAANCELSFLCNDQFETDFNCNKNDWYRLLGRFLMYDCDSD